VSPNINWAGEPVPNLSQYDTLEDACADFEWRIPDTYNIATDVVTKHADGPEQVALYQKEETGERSQYTFQEVERLSNQVANGLAERGIGRGERIGIVSSQRLETALAHVAAWKVGAITVPLSVQYDDDALAFRLNDNETTLIFAEEASYDAVSQVAGDITSLKYCVGIDGAPSIAGVETTTFDAMKGDPTFDPVDTAHDDPAVILYTSGTTGDPKGVVVAHEYLLGHLPGIQTYYELPWHNIDEYVICSPADWAWAGGLFDILLPAWHYSIPVVGYHTEEFAPENIFELIDDYGVTHMLLTATVMNKMRQVDESQYDTSSIVAVLGAGESIQSNLRTWAGEMFDAPINGGYGQTEANLVVGYCSQWHDRKTHKVGCIGQALPGHTVDVIDDKGNVKDVDTNGRIATKRPDPVVMREYWNNPEKTESAFIGDWFDSGDIGYRDEEGYLWFTARAEDVIMKGDHVIGPSTVEDALSQHDAVAETAVVGLDDPSGRDYIKTFVVPGYGYGDDDDTKDDILETATGELDPNAVPDELEFIDELPTTTTGKIQRFKLKEREEG
jgi:acetyl-CoA synthetase